MSGTVLPPNLRLIGGEMLAWSDENSQDCPPPAAGPLLRHLAEAACRGACRVLVAGPHRADLVGAISAVSASISCLLRSYTDGAALAARFPAARVLCGSLAKLDQEEQFDVVVALDGLDRLCSVEGVPLDWGQTLDALLAVLRPGGRLVMALDNALGVHRLVELNRGESGSDWTPVAEYDESRPRSLVHLVDRLAASGLLVGAGYYGYGRPNAPSVLVGIGVAGAEAAAEGRLDGAVATAMAAAHLDTPVLADPRRLATVAMRSGVGAELAPVWVIAADNGSPPPLMVPEIMIADAGAAAERSGWCVACAITAADGGWLREPLEDTDARTRSSGPVRRDPHRLAGPLPTGCTLEQSLLACCRRRDVPALRILLRGYAGWLAEQCDERGLLPGDRCFATPGNTVYDGGFFSVLDPSWSLAGAVRYEVALARGLWQFAAMVITGGHPHPWPTGTDADSLTIILAGMAGHELENLTVRQATDLEADIRTAVRGLDQRERAELACQLAEVTPACVRVDLDGHRELHNTVRWLSRELEHAEAKVTWYEELLASRERALTRAERMVKIFTESRSFRVGRLLIRPVKTARRDLRRALRTVRGRGCGRTG